MKTFATELPRLRDHLKRVEHEIVATAHIDDVFWQAHAVLAANDRLRDDVLHEWMFLTYVDSFVIRLRRLTESHHRSLSLRMLLDGIMGLCPLERGVVVDEWHYDDPALESEWFNKLAGAPGATEIHKERVDLQLGRLAAAAAEINEYANAHVAHASAKPSAAIPTAIQGREALVEVFHVYQWTSALLTGTGLSVPSPTPQTNWHAAFKLPWVPHGRQIPESVSLNTLLRGNGFE